MITDLYPQDDVNGMSQPVLELIDVTKSYVGRGSTVTALGGVTLTVRTGDYLAIVGSSGSGKSTMLHIMGTLDRPTTGVVRLAGQDISTMGDNELSSRRARTIGFVFQDSFLLDGVSVLDNVADGLLYRGIPQATRRQRATEALHTVGLSHRLQHQPAQLSGGERQRAAIARAVVGRPALVLADEPTGALDSVNGAAILNLLSALHADGTTIALITHDREIAAHLPRQVELRDGQIITDTALIATASGGAL